MSKHLCLTLFFLVLFIFPSFSQMLERGPYIQNNTETSVVIKWYTNVPTTSKVVYGTTVGANNLSVINSDLVTDHEITVPNLDPDTKYFYAVGSTVALIAGNDNEHYFETHPPAGTHKPVKFWVLGDAGTGNSEQRSVRDGYLNYTNGEMPKFILQLGDNAYEDGTIEEYDDSMFDNMYEDIINKIPMRTTIGNHDGMIDSDDQIGNNFMFYVQPKNAEAGGAPSGTEAYYSFDYGNIHFVCLDSEDSDVTPGSDQHTWLQNDLANHTQDWLIVYSHHPIVDSGRRSDYGNPTVTREHLMPLLEAAGADLVMNGDSHVYQQSAMLHGHYGDSYSFDSTTMIMDEGDGYLLGPTGPYQKEMSGPNADLGTVYVVSGSAGKVSNSPGPHDHPASQQRIASLGSLSVEVYYNQLTVSFVDQNGDVLDEFTIEKRLDTAPIWVSTDVVDPQEDIPYSHQLIASDAENDILSYTATYLPTWMTLDPATGILSGTPDFTHIGSDSAVVELRDSYSTPIVKTFYFDILNTNDLPQILTGTPPNATEHQFFSHQVVSFDQDTGTTLTYFAEDVPAWLSLSTNGILNGTPGDLDVGINPVQLGVTDGIDSVYQSFDLIVNNVNDSPEFVTTTLPNGMSTVSYSHQLEILDLDPSDVITYQITGASWLTVDASGLLSGTPLLADTGLYTIDISINDGFGPIAASFNFEILPFNSAPTFTSLPDTVTDEGTAYQYQITAADLEGDDMYLSATSLPLWLSLDTASWTITGTPDDAELGIHQITLMITDSISTNASYQSFNLEVFNVNDLPVLEISPDQQIEVETSFSYAILSDDEDTNDVVSILVHSIPTWASYDSTTNMLTGVPTDGDIGLHNLNFDLDDGHTTVNHDFDIEVFKVTGIADIGDESGIHIFPNPSSFGFKTSFYIEEIQTVSYALFTLNGQQVFGENLGQRLPGTVEFEFGQDLQTQVYVLKIQVGEKQIVRQVVKW